LVRKGLAEEAGQAESGLEGGRPSVLYRPAGGTSPDAWQTSQTSQTSRASYEIRGLSPLTPLTQGDGGRGFDTPKPGTAVERFQNGNWSNGWVVVDAQDPERVKIAQLGNSNLRISNMRWDLDVRLCTGSPFKESDTDIY